jgi:hypothetical protein
MRRPHDVIELLRPASAPQDLASCETRVLLNPSFPRSLDPPAIDDTESESVDSD